MEHIAAVLLLVGCSGDLSQCREIATPITIFETAEECEATISPAIGRVVARYPRVFSQCVQVDPAVEEEGAELLWQMNPDGTLIATIEVPIILVAARMDGREKDYLSQE
ncbi:MAG: hypothetical protein KF810_23295 [Rhizobiaceae bacterium]|nr:hypothetical protein [Rhizobiaceae bacterium]